MVGRFGEGATALTLPHHEPRTLIDRPEESFDWVDFACPCPSCGACVKGFRTKDLCNQRDQADFRDVQHFYAECRCGAWIDFIRKPAIDISDFEMRVEVD